MIEENMKYVLSLNHPLSGEDGLMTDVKDVLKQKEGITIGNLINTFLNRYQGNGDELNLKQTLESSIKEAQDNPQEKFLSIKSVDPDTETYRKIQDNQGVYTDLIDPDTKVAGLFENYNEFSESMNKEVPYKGLYLDVCADFIEGR